MREPTLWILNASEVVPVTAGFPVISDGAVVCGGDRILWVGPEKDLPEEFAPPLDADVLDARRGVVLPGLIDCHTHLVFAGSRANEFAQRLTGATYEDILAAGGGILGTVRATRDASTQQLAKLGRHRLRKLLAGGVTTVEAKSGYGLYLETSLHHCSGKRFGLIGFICDDLRGLGGYTVSSEDPVANVLALQSLSMD